MQTSCLPSSTAMHTRHASPLVSSAAKDRPLRCPLSQPLMRKTMDRLQRPAPSDALSFQPCRVLNDWLDLSQVLPPSSACRLRHACLPSKRLEWRKRDACILEPRAAADHLIGGSSTRESERRAAQAWMALCIKHHHTHPASSCTACNLSPESLSYEAWGNMAHRLPRLQAQCAIRTSLTAAVQLRGWCQASRKSARSCVGERQHSQSPPRHREEPAAAAGTQRGRVAPTCMMASARRFLSTGLDRKPSMPAARHSSRSRSLAFAVIATIGAAKPPRRSTCAHVPAAHLSSLPAALIS